MDINYEALAMFGKFGGMMLGLLLLVWLIALLTPKAAGLIDRLSRRNPSPERVQDSIDSEKNYQVYSIFEDRPMTNKRFPQDVTAQKDDAEKPAGAPRFEDRPRGAVNGKSPSENSDSGGKSDNDI